MLFSSFEFLFLFLPLFLIFYFFTPKKWRYVVIFLWSLVFYGFGEPRFLPLLLLSAALHYGIALLAARKKGAVWLAVGLDLALLLFFKYYDAAAGRLALPELGLYLPLGISFYSFSALAYVIDVSRGEKPEKDPLRYGAYFAFFPKLLSGPITRHRSLFDELREPRPDASRVSRGIMRFVCGLSKKLLLASPASEMWSYLRALDAGERGALGSWLALVFYAFWLYYDFSGYTDMAIGLAELMGLSLPENFNYPYIAESPRDFWRRWHITLSSWFRDYVYIPLGGSRCALSRQLFNLLAVWLLTGLWHGSTWNFLLWGLYWFVLLAASRVLPKRLFSRFTPALKRVLMIPVILVGWLIFAMEDLGEGVAFFGSLWGGASGEVVWYELFRNSPLLLVLALGATPLPRRVYERRVKGKWGSVLLCLFGFLLSLAYLAGGTHEAFLYFRF